MSLQAAVGDTEGTKGQKEEGRGSSEGLEWSRAWPGLYGAGHGQAYLGQGMGTPSGAGPGLEVA